MADSTLKITWIYLNIVHEMTLGETVKDQIDCIYLLIYLTKYALNIVILNY